ncbi:hypothetical protein NE237_009875 [Protea cynaroides]|uniref:Uncharacterized protein n=1 Tax=Protea cynaroides TaxID=273540 RepID=A0A9Q0R154_9MAGN|nr:hypothetical protein NE237_009875 [Protea cynaroides]
MLPSSLAVQTNKPRLGTTLVTRASVIQRPPHRIVIIDLHSIRKVRSLEAINRIDGKGYRVDDCGLERKTIGCVQSGQDSTIPIDVAAIGGTILSESAAALVSSKTTLVMEVIITDSSFIGGGVVLVDVGRKGAIPRPEGAVQGGRRDGLELKVDERAPTQHMIAGWGVPI